MVYAGVPAGVSAFRAARKVLAAEGIDTGETSPS
jgi:alkylhydroperoxidase/carboxymuconolactone decarboxylase family protein YurZ